MSTFPDEVNLAKTIVIDIAGFAWQRTNGGTRTNNIHVAIPYWFLIVTGAILGYCLPAAVVHGRFATTNVPLRFSLRTLLIATTLAAVVLGLSLGLRDEFRIIRPTLGSKARL